MNAASLPDLNSEFFVIPAEGPQEFVGYAPLRGVITLLKPDHVALLRRLKAGSPTPDDLDSPLLKALCDAQVVDGPKEPRPTSAEGTPYRPTSTTLFLTDRCPMACRYCYAGQASAASRPGVRMAPRLARAAVDFISENAKMIGQKAISVGFHGGGEPTAAWTTLRSTVEYAREGAEKEGLQFRCALSTGGVLTPSKARWMAGNFTNVTVSCDGPPDVQNRNRPLKDGSPSSPIVYETLRIFAEEELDHCIQAAVTAPDAGRLPELVEWFAENTSARMIKFEPVAAAGSCAGQYDLVPDPLIFANSFMQACRTAQDKGVTVTFSGIQFRTGPLSHFCGAFGSPFCVTPDGLVSACFEAFNQGADHADLFLIGAWNEDESRFAVDVERLERLRRRNITRLDQCARCFCKYSCAGDCLTRALRERSADADADARVMTTGARCQTVRETTRQSLIHVAKRGADQPATCREGNDG